MSRIFPAAIVAFAVASSADAQCRQWSPWYPPAYPVNPATFWGTPQPKPLPPPPKPFVPKPGVGVKEEESVAPKSKNGGAKEDEPRIPKVKLPGLPDDPDDLGHGDRPPVQQCRDALTDLVHLPRIDLDEAHAFAVAHV